LLLGGCGYSHWLSKPWKAEASSSKELYFADVRVAMLAIDSLAITHCAGRINMKFLNDL